MIKRILLLFLPLFTYAQNSYQVIYEARQEFDRSKLESPKPDLLAVLNNSESKTYEYKLIVNKTNSHFKKVDKIVAKQVRQKELKENQERYSTIKLGVERD